MKRFANLALILAASTALSGCFSVPDFRPSRPAAPAPAPTVGAPLAPPTQTAGVAETACMEAGRAAGFDVSGVVGTREVADASGVVMSRDVILNAARGSQGLEVRCSFSYANGQARIMTL